MSFIAGFVCSIVSATLVVDSRLLFVYFLMIKFEMKGSFLLSFFLNDVC